jgi:hypothetical protein
MMRCFRTTLSNLVVLEIVRPVSVEHPESAYLRESWLEMRADSQDYCTTRDEEWGIR